MQRIWAAAAEVEPNSLRLVRGHCETLSGPYVRQQGEMGVAQAPHLSGLADNAAGFGADHRSPVFIFEDGVQLPYPHSLHDDIRQIGRGRFSHWGEAIYFSTTDGSDPNRNGREYSIIRPNRPMQ